MIITDLFSHKIHSSKPEWQDKLIELASIFTEFDGQVYDRNKIVNRLKQISPRASFVSRDASKFRDEISAYPAYLGLYRLEFSEKGWILYLSETAKQFLIVEEPNVSAFMLLQLLLFQYPNGMGVAYYSNSNGLRIQANTRDRTFEFIRKGIHISPLRLICLALKADSNHRKCSIFESVVTIEEIFILVNHPKTNKSVLPALKLVEKILQEARNQLLFPPDHFESRFHILNHTDFISTKRGKLSLRETANEIDKLDLLKKFEVITNLDTQFNDFSNIKDEEEFEKVIKSGSYGRYFDSLLSLNTETVKILANDSVFEVSDKQRITEDKGTPVSISLPVTYPLRKRNRTISASKPAKKRTQFADPEVTRIKRQKSNLSHKLILQQLDEYIRSLGSKPFENEHIDLFAEIPKDGSFIFEVKSVRHDNLLSQARKGLSQLYEYHFRYQNEIGSDVTLCLVFPKEPNEIDWLQEYLCLDRNIAIIWFEEDGKLNYSKFCPDLVKPLLTSS